MLLEVFTKFEPGDGGKVRPEVSLEGRQGGGGEPHPVGSVAWTA